MSFLMQIFRFERPRSLLFSIFLASKFASEDPYWFRFGLENDIVSGSSSSGQQCIFTVRRIVIIW